MVVLVAEGIGKSIGDRTILDNVTFGLEEATRTVIVARNGAGKSTLLRILAGQEAPDTGSVTIRDGLRLALLPQTPVLDPEATALEAAIGGDSPAARIVAQYELLLSIGDNDAAIALAPQIDALSAWDYEERASRLLTALSINDLSQQVKFMSGGQRKRVALCRTLLDEPDILLLDEPTNHLDAATTEWLETYLARRRTTLLMVTHDRYLLDRVCNRIIEIDRNNIFTYEGNYDYYLRRRAERIEALNAETDRVRNTLRREQEWINRQPQARATKAKYRIDAYYDLKERAALDLTERNVNLQSSKTYIGSKIFEAHNISKRFGDKVILNNFSFTFGRGEKLGIIGGNGVGKTTFIKMLQGLETADSGTWDVGTTVNFGYYSQDGLKLKPDQRVVEAVTEIAENITMPDGSHVSPMQFLKHFLFDPADLQKPIEKLSGGERARLHLAITLMRQPNFLILDEPTNDLDIMTLDRLEAYLRDFNGCLIVISHDRHFLDTVVDHLFVMKGDGCIKDFPGTYSEYRAAEEAQRKARSEQSASPASQTPSRPTTERQRRLSYKERKEFEALSDEIASLEAEKASLEAIFSGQAHGDVESASKRYNQVNSLLDEKELRWLELSEIES